MRILIVGSGAREHAIAKALAASSKNPTLFCCGTTKNPGIALLTEDYWQGDIQSVPEVLASIASWSIELAIIGPEAPLEQGLADALEKAGIATVGPKKTLARIETSKSFTRELFKTHAIPGSPRFKTFHELTGALDFLNALGEGGYVIKADGLMGGKGVKVAGDHLHSINEAYQFCQLLHQSGHAFVIEEKLIGQEFSLLCFCDGKRLVPMPLVQDNKRAFVGDKGPNTGGMGSYSLSDHRLPFVTEKDINDAGQINQAVIDALADVCHAPYRGILYGSFIATRQGVSLIEYNARFGDPEAMNILSVLDSDFVDICVAITSESLEKEPVQFKKLATVCKYAVPLGYPDNPATNVPIDVSGVQNKEALYFAAVNEKDGILYATGSRAVAVVGIAPTLMAAEKAAEEEINRIQGPLFHREDIGTDDLINSRIKMMQDLRMKKQGTS